MTRPLLTAVARLLAVALAAAVVVVASPWTNPPDTDFTGRSLAVQQAVVSMSSAWDTPSDCTAVASYFAPNATWRADGAPPVYGRAAVQSACAQSAAANAFQYDSMLETGFDEESGMGVWRWSFVVSPGANVPPSDISVLSRSYTTPAGGDDGGDDADAPAPLFADTMDAFVKQVFVANTQTVTLIPPSPQCSAYIAAYRAAAAAYGVGNCTAYSQHFVADPVGTQSAEGAVLRVGRDPELVGRAAIASACHDDARGAATSWRQVESFGCVEYARTILVAWRWYYAVADGTAPAGGGSAPKPSYVQYISEVVFAEGANPTPLIARELAVFTNRLGVGSELPSGGDRECEEGGVHSQWYIVLGVLGSVALFGLGLLQMWCCMKSRMSAAAGGGGGHGHGHSQPLTGGHGGQSHGYEPPGQTSV